MIIIIRYKRNQTIIIATKQRTRNIMKNERRITQGTLSIAHIITIHSTRTLIPEIAKTFITHNGLGRVTIIAPTTMNINETNIILRFSYGTGSRPAFET